MAFCIQPDVVFVRLIVFDDQLLRAATVLLAVVHLDAGLVVATRLLVRDVNEHRVIHPLLVLLAELV